MHTALARFGCAVHADWSVDPRKRWMAVARRTGACWHLSAPVPVGDVATLLARLRQTDGAVLLGLDLPLGLPRAYAARHAREADFPAFLRGLAARPAFFRVAATLDEVTPDRPFYPARGVAGMTRAAHAAALGLDGADGLNRAVDRATAERPAGAPPFWTLGANQSGRAALAAWRDLLLPALAHPAPPLLWPFDGPLPTLAASGSIVMAETYPAEAMRHLGLRMGGSKRRQADRLALAPALLSAMERLQAVPDAAMRCAVAGGFDADAAGEDRFDCTLGVLCVLNVLAGHRPAFVPDDPWIGRWEGWVLGQTALPGARPSSTESVS
jgi:hypothetical protein